MKNILRLFGATLMLSGWAVAAMCLHIVRTPNPADPNSSKLVVIPKARLGITMTYVDARKWTIADVPANAEVVSRMLDAGKADQLKYLADPKCKLDIQSQLTDALAGGKGSSTTRGSVAAGSRDGSPLLGANNANREVGLELSF